jgi:hypothetical protein
MAAPIGNTNAANAKIWQQALKRALARKANSTVDSGLDTLADKVIDKAWEGDVWALTEVGNRMDGKPAQALGNDPDNPLPQATIVNVYAGNPPD